MPNRDGTGPNGKGPKTGRGMGNCAKNTTSPNQIGRGQGLGRGNGQGRNNQ